jgi:hypothetical protein
MTDNFNSTDRCSPYLGLPKAVEPKPGSFGALLKEAISKDRRNGQRKQS